MITFLLQEPFVPEGITLSVEISIYEARFVVPHIEQVAKLLYEAERKIQKAEFEAEQHAPRNG